MEKLQAETLLGLLQMYETAIAELCATGDPGVEGLITRFMRKQSEVIAELAERQRKAIPSARGGIRQLRNERS